MYRNRSQARQQQRQRRKRAARRLLVLNFILFVLLLGAGSLLVFGNKNQGPPAASGGTPLAEASPSPSAPAPAPSEPAAPTASPSAAPTPTPTPSAAPTAAPSESPKPAASESPSPDPDQGAEAQPTAAPSGWSGLAPKDAPTIRLAFTGDILLASKVADLMESKGLDYPFTGAADRLSKPDLTAGNLETPITARGNPATDKQFVFKGKPAYVKPLRDAGFDVVTLANNHTLDQGVQGLLDTIGHLDDAGLPHVGGGRDDKEAYAPVILESGGVKVAYLGVSRVLPVVEWKAGPTRAGVAEAYDPARAQEAIRIARKKADLVVVMVHWGRERADQPVDHQRSLARGFIDAGADLIIGSHPHVLQGFELYKGKWIAYSLGNFIFTSNANSNTSESGVLDAVCSKDGRCGLRFHPMKIVQARPAPVAGEQLAAQLKRLNGISKAASIGDDGTVRPR
ncbi:CapA family protein [Paenibacillus albicereus]|uniref:CapA family protein n=1 Tax=Paenibacillus albicereus TaxID=2726185 RepID=A0A6H2GW04_9BACL|nr:CapA family protein [Paenibacillus albicereus]QJC51572.1 CapA family protein [Paenibacillus albicereus]